MSGEGKQRQTMHVDWAARPEKGGTSYDEERERAGDVKVGKAGVRRQGCTPGGGSASARGSPNRSRALPPEQKLCSSPTNERLSPRPVQFWQLAMDCTSIKMRSAPVGTAAATEVIAPLVFRSARKDEKNQLFSGSETFRLNEIPRH